MDDVKIIKGVQYQVIKVDAKNKNAILKQVSKLHECIRYGGQYCHISGSKMKRFLSLDAAAYLFDTQFKYTK